MLNLDDLVRSLVKESKQARTDPKKREKQKQVFTEATADLRASVEQTRRKRVAQQWVPQELVLIITSSQCLNCGTISEFANPHLLVSCRNSRFGITDMKSVKTTLNWKQQFGQLPTRKEYRTLDSDVCLHCFDSLGATDAKTEIGSTETHGHVLPGRTDAGEVHPTHTKPGNGAAQVRVEIPDREHAAQETGSGEGERGEQDRRERSHAPSSLNDLLGSDWYD